jgi:hypothetical protein
MATHCGRKVKKHPKLGVKVCGSCGRCITTRDAGGKLIGTVGRPVQPHATPALELQAFIMQTRGEMGLPLWRCE